VAERPSMDGKRRKILGAMRRAAMEFESANVNGDGSLDLVQFEQMMLVRTGKESIPPQQVLDWYDTLTKDNDSLSLDEYFCFCVYDVAEEYGGSIQAIFETYDLDGSGVLSRAEFSKAIVELGFAPATDKLLELFDNDGSGQISYLEIMYRIRKEREDPAFREMSRAVTWHDADELRDSLTDEGEETRLAKVKSTEAVKRELEQLLKDNKKRVMDLFNEFDDDGSGLITKREFRKCLRELGFTGSEERVRTLFDELDTSANSTISFPEMNHWLNDGVEEVVDPSLTWEERAAVAAEEDDAIVKPAGWGESRPLVRPRSASTGGTPALQERPMWRPVGNRPAWPLNLGLQREREREKLRSPPREQAGPRTPRQTGARGQGYTPKTKACELRDIPQLNQFVDQVKGQVVLPELYISRKLNWPPKGLRLLQPAVIQGGNRVLATYATLPGRPLSARPRLVLR